jgi:hypothetical protein
LCPPMQWRHCQVRRSSCLHWWNRNEA